jgi:hypothetical protein
VADSADKVFKAKLGVIETLAQADKLNKQTNPIAFK